MITIKFQVYLGIVSTKFTFKAKQTVYCKKGEKSYSLLVYLNELCAVGTYIPIVKLSRMLHVNIGKSATSDHKYVIVSLSLYSR